VKLLGSSGRASPVNPGGRGGPSEGSTLAGVEERRGKNSDFDQALQLTVMGKSDPGVDQSAYGWMTNQPRREI